MEAYGNAKTIQNNNSTRFVSFFLMKLSFSLASRVFNRVKSLKQGKFIHIHFSNGFSIAGITIETFLFDKSRITTQTPVERNYNIFYSLCSNAFPDMTSEY